MLGGYMKTKKIISSLAVSLIITVLILIVFYTQFDFNPEKVTGMLILVWVLNIIIELLVLSLFSVGYLSKRDLKNKQSRLKFGAALGAMTWGIPFSMYFLFLVINVGVDEWEVIGDIGLIIIGSGVFSIIGMIISLIAGLVYSKKYQ
jgi:hypothetical protein